MEVHFNPPAGDGTDLQNIWLSMPQHLSRIHFVLIKMVQRLHILYRCASVSLCKMIYHYHVLRSRYDHASGLDLKPNS